MMPHPCVRALRSRLALRAQAAARGVPPASFAASSRFAFSFLLGVHPSPPCVFPPAPPASLAPPSRPLQRAVVPLVATAMVPARVGGADDVAVDEDVPERSRVLRPVRGVSTLRSALRFIRARVAVPNDGLIQLKTIFYSYNNNKFEASPPRAKFISNELMK